MKWLTRRSKQPGTSDPPAGNGASSTNEPSPPQDRGGPPAEDEASASVQPATVWPPGFPVVFGRPWIEDVIKVEEYRQDDTMVVRAELPGVDPDKDVRLTVVDGRLAIEAERHEETEAERDGYMLRELRYGTFTRTVPLGAGVTAASITATYKDGLLEVRIPVTALSPTPPPARIPITTS